MTINKYTGKTEEEAMSKVRKELGNAAAEGTRWSI